VIIAQIHTATGALLAVADDDKRLPALAASESRVVFPHLDAEPAGLEWSRSALTWVTPPPPVVPTTRKGTQRAFMGRLSKLEQNALNYVRLDTATPLSIRSQLETLKELRDMADDIDLDDPDTAPGVDYALWVLSRVVPADAPGHIDPTDVPARRAAWLAEFPVSPEG